MTQIKGFHGLKAEIKEKCKDRNRQELYIKGIRFTDRCKRFNPGLDSASPFTSCRLAPLYVLLNLLQHLNP